MCGGVAVCRFADSPVWCPVQAGTGVRNEHVATALVHTHRGRDSKRGLAQCACKHHRVVKGESR